MACNTVANNNKQNLERSARHINMKNGKSFTLKAKGSGDKGLESVFWFRRFTEKKTLL